MTATTNTTMGIVDMASIFERSDMCASPAGSPTSCLSTCGNASLSSGVVYRTVEADNLPDGRERDPGRDELGEGTGLDGAPPGWEADLPHGGDRFPRTGRAGAAPRRPSRGPGRGPGSLPR